MKKSIAIVCYSLLAVVILALATVGVAYYTKKDIYDGILSGNVELLFDRLNTQAVEGQTQSALEQYQATLSNETYDPNAPWGSEKNPYVISNVRHLYNLGELQKLGFFFNNYIKKNYTDANGDGKIDPEVDTYDETNGTTMPYFLVCTPEGEPTCIDGKTFGRNISSIGTEEYPFIGSVKGAFVEVETPIIATSEAGGAYQTTVSTICDIKAVANPGDVDVGLFGYVGYLGNEAADGEIFKGQISELSNLLLYDVTVEVKSSNWLTIVDQFVASNMHDYAYSDYVDNETAINDIPHENHHIGILAGHVAYTNVSYISVFYSDDTIAAMDFRDASSDNTTGAKANYLSSCGILGYIDNMNPTVNGDQITAGSGTDNSNITYSPTGGGGKLTGTAPGYVLAENIYSAFNYISVTTKDENNEETTAYKKAGSDVVYYIKNAYKQVEVEGEITYEPLCTEWINDNAVLGGFLDLADATEYYFWDGVFTFALSDFEDTIETTWDDINQKFSYGSADRNNWTTELDVGAVAAVLAFIDPISSDEELYTAMQAGKQIFIADVSTTADGTQNYKLVDLYNQTKHDTTVDGYSGLDREFTLSYEDVDRLVDTSSDVDKWSKLETLYASIQNGTSGLNDDDIDEIISAMPEGYQTKEKLLDALNDFIILDVGTSSSSISIDDLKKKYNIDLGLGVTTEHRDYDEFGDAVTLNSDGTVAEYYDYDDTSYTGYFSYTTNTNTNTLTCYWYDVSGVQQAILLQGSEVTAGQFFAAENGAYANKVGTWANEDVFRYTLDGTTYIGIALANNTTYRTTNTTATRVNGVFRKTLGTANYFYAYPGDAKRYNSSGAEVTLTATDTTTSSGRSLYMDASNITGVLLERVPTYTLSNENKGNYLTMLSLLYNFDLSADQTVYVFASGSDEYTNDTKNFTHTVDLGFFGKYERTPTLNAKSTSAAINFTNGYCQISYTADGQTRYLSFNNTSNYYIASSDGASEQTQLMLYTVESTQTIASGRASLEPTVSKVERSVSDYVLWPNSVDTGGGNPDYQEFDTTNTYSVISLEGLMWSDGEGSRTVTDAYGTRTDNGNLDKYDLLNKFHMKKTITSGTRIDLGWLIDYSSGGYVLAPVGTDGEYANIPTGCVAFRITSVNANSPERIRVIVAVPAYETYNTELTSNGDYTDYNFYLNLWHSEVAGGAYQSFDVEDAYARILLPKSYPYRADVAAGNTGELGANFIYVNEGTIQPGSTTNTEVTKGTTDYLCSLNGDKVLLAYEFEVNQTGIYIIGMSGWNNATNQFVSGEDFPMEVIYASSTSVASTGRDGTNSSSLGTIDFVYSYEATGDNAAQANGRVITVDMTDPELTSETNPEDYQYYYESNVVMYFDNSKERPATDPPNTTYTRFIDINSGIVRIKRYITTTNGAEQTTIGFKVTGPIGPEADQDFYIDTDDPYIKIAQHSQYSDALDVSYDTDSSLNTTQ